MIFFFSFFTDRICGDKCSDYYWDCTCGGSQLPKDKFCCIPSNASCSGIEDGDVNCPNGTAYDYDQKCGNECSISTTYNYVAISTILDNYECPKSDYFSKVSSGTKGSKDFKEYCEIPIVNLYFSLHSLLADWDPRSLPSLFASFWLGWRFPFHFSGTRCWWLKEVGGPTCRVRRWSSGSRASIPRSNADPRIASVLVASLVY